MKVRDQIIYVFLRKLLFERGHLAFALTEDAADLRGGLLWGGTLHLAIQAWAESHLSLVRGMTLETILGEDLLASMGVRSALMLCGLLRKEVGVGAKYSDHQGCCKKTFPHELIQK
jgi:hypothetical protein